MVMMVMMVLTVNAPLEQSFVMTVSADMNICVNEHLVLQIWVFMRTKRVLGVQVN